MENYKQLKARHTKEINEFYGLFFAFDNETFYKRLADFGYSNAKELNLKEIVVYIGAGGYLIKSKVQDWNDLYKKQDKELKEFKKHEKELIKGIVYEMFNHEFCITYDMQDALDCFSLKYSELDKNFIKKIMKEYNKQYKKELKNDLCR